MGAALARGLAKEHSLFFFSRDDQKGRQLEEEGCGVACRELKQAVEKVEGVILAVKPQDLPTISDQLKGLLPKGILLLSVLAGASLSTLQRYFPDARVVRLMLNLAIIEKEGAIALTASSFSPEEKNNLLRLFSPLGKTIWLDEHQMDAFTSLAGSGPAFIFALTQAMIEAGMEMGFSSKESQDLVYQTLRGSLARLEQTDLAPEELIAQVASPGGTTRAGLHQMEEHHLKEGLIATFLAAKERAQELNQRVQ